MEPRKYWAFGLSKVQKLKLSGPMAYRQICMVHLARNLHHNLSKANSKEAMRLWRDIKDARDFNEGEIYFNNLVDLVKLENRIWLIF
ncbi:transposase [Leptospira idonii]|uniref:Transposase n=1 Tax=Leptospira idonii TaxID=1193500 RepID=A0A4R9M2V6_9LEPT|nr:hypothetical protein EHS15_04625 [Leptospira idonii]